MAGMDSGHACRLATASRLTAALDTEGFPSAHSWSCALPVSFCRDWQGNNPDPLRNTEVRLLWSPEFIYLRFVANFREIYVYPGKSCRRDRLWERDVAEIFIRPGSEEPHHYREFEISPNGDWLDLDIFPGGKADLHCSMRSRVALDEDAGIWTAEMALPTGSLARAFDPSEIWRVNFFRVEGAEPNRFYSSWQATHAPEPNFHVPDAFGELRFCT